MSKVYNFGEKTTEYSAKDGKEIPVWISPKYEQSKKAVIKMLESPEYKDVLDESDFWILMNRTKTGKMAYTGLIISHNGCLKINDVLPEELKFNPRAVSYFYHKSNAKGEDVINYNDSLIFEYNSARITNYGETEDKQKIFEIGEVSSKNCTNDYPYAMALKRCMDRVILKNSKLAYNGVYSDSEAEEFTKPEEEVKEVKPEKFIKATDKQLETIKSLYNDKRLDLINLLATLGKKKIDELSVQEASEIIKKSGE